MGADVVDVAQAFPQHHVQHRVVERDVGAGQDRQEQIGRRRGVGAARIDDDDFERRVARLGVLDAAEQHRMRVGGVGAGDEHALGVLDVVVAGGRRIGAQRRLVAGDRRRHAQARIGIDVVGADQPFGELVEDVVVLGQQLARNIERDAVGAVLADDRGELVGGEIERALPAHALARGVRACAAIPGYKRARRRSRGQMQRRALGAQAAEIRRMVGIAAHAGDPVAIGLDHDAAADAAVTAGGFDFSHGHTLATDVPVGYSI